MRREWRRKEAGRKERACAVGERCGSAALGEQRGAVRCMRCDDVWAEQSGGVSGGTVAACARRSARRVCGTLAALCIAKTREWALG
jgi:hypothetical protein